MTGYRKHDDEESKAGATLPPPRFCQVNGCGKKATVLVLLQRSGTYIARCARHYMDEVDEKGKGATSKLFSKRLEIEREEMEEIGLEKYREESRPRVRAFIRQMGRRGIGR